MVKRFFDIGPIETGTFRGLEQLGGNWLPKYQRIYGISPIQEGEAFSSWVARASLDNVISLKLLMKSIGCETPGHLIDIGHVQIDLIKIGSILGFEDPSLSQINFPVSSILSEPDFLFLTIDKNHSPIYKYCPACLTSDVTPFFRDSWRWISTRICPIHNIVLINNCYKCKRKINLSRISKRRKNGVFCKRPSLLVCNSCMTNLGEAPVESVKENILIIALKQQEEITNLIRSTFCKDIGNSHPPGILKDSCIIQNEPRKKVANLVREYLDVVLIEDLNACNRLKSFTWDDIR
ncbi:TniQ family protein [Polynucleobacter sp. Ross1-W9]|uniref:TniQ family protein n=1 Tax=Polynucleobacter parvulilacunae TaxID=1855631 RepID=UPI001C0D1EF1|nr:TniQ family protein [Polynucleobacter parvulilacunae]MBU3556208.1 TniQ family protein [Polynucleobacter parvulilacunae]